MSQLADVNEVYAKDPKLNRDDIKSLKIWKEKQPHLPKLTELQYILFLQSCYYSNEQAKLAIENFFTVRTMWPEVFSNINPNHPSVQRNLNVALTHFLPKLSTKGHKVIFMRLLDTNADNYHLIDQVKLFDMITMLSMHLNGTNEGICAVFDFEGSSFGHLLKISPVVSKKYLFYVQEALPIRLREIHAFNVPNWIDKGLAILKPFMKKELFDMIQLHTSMETFYESVPKEILPKDYGGTAESIDVLAEQTKSILEQNTEFFKDLQNQVVDDSRRTEKARNYSKIFGMEGTFKKLEVD